MLSLAADLYRAKDYEAALRVLEGMIAQNPGDLVAHFNAGQACNELGDYYAAARHFEGVTMLASDVAKAWLKFGSAALMDQQHEKATHALFVAMDMDPENPEVQHAYASMASTMLNDDTAITHYQTAQRLRPNYANAEVGEAFCHLRRGRYREGWRLFEKRWGMPNGGREYHGIPYWDGSRKGTIILRSEQGHGDTLQFLRYIPFVAQRVGRVVVEAHPAMRRLIERVPGVDEVIDAGAEPPAADFQCSLMSLPYIFGTELDTIPPPIPWEFWPDNHPRKFTVGLCWAGGSRPNEPAAHAIDKRRSVSFEALAPILNVPGVKFVSLQKEGNRLPGSIDDCRDFHDTAGLIARLDAVVSVDTAVCHLAATMGVPTLLLNRFDTDWRWLRDRADSPWYPSMRIFRQPILGEWVPVMQSAAEALREMVGC